jgi:CDP-diglyceride synthetase
LILGFIFSTSDGNYLSYIISTAFIGSAIIVEPKTSPSKTKEQIIYGITIALLIMGLSLLHLPNAPIIGLLLGNAFYFLYKNEY